MCFEAIYNSIFKQISLEMNKLYFALVRNFMKAKTSQNARPHSFFLPHPPSGEFLNDELIKPSA